VIQDKLIKDLFGDLERALTVYARSVLGVNPAEMGSPWASAVNNLSYGDPGQHGQAP